MHTLMFKALIERCSQRSWQRLMLACAVLFFVEQGVARAEFVEPTFAEERSPKLPAGAKALTWAECSVMKDNAGDLDLGMGRAGFQCPKSKILMGQGVQVPGVKRQTKALYLFVDGQAPVRLSISEQWLAPFLDTVHSTDLNADGKPDFVLEFSFHGNGLAAVRTQLIFIVSDAKGYRFSHFKDVTSPALAQFGSLVSAAPGASAGAAGAAAAMPIVFTLGRFASDLSVTGSSQGSGKQSKGKLKTTDGKPHVFFVFDLLGFKANESLPGLLGQEGFPRWVLYQNNPGASETTLISAADKLKLWSSPLKGLRSGYLVP